MTKLTRFENAVKERIVILDKRKQDLMKKDDQLTLGIVELEINRNRDLLTILDIIKSEVGITITI